MITAQSAGNALQNPHNSRRGSVTVLAALIFPALVGLGAWSLNSAYMHRKTLTLRHTVQATALAAANKLTTYYTSGSASSATVVAMGQTVAVANMPTATYGTVIPASNIILGNWDSASSTFASLATSGGTMPNAVKVIGLATAANGNAASMLFSSITGIASKDLTTSAIAGFGTNGTFHTIVVNDLSSSFSPSIANQRAADQAILDCIKNNSGATTKYGITGLTGHSTIYVALQTAAANYATIQTKINALKSCGNTGMPACSGSNIAAAIYSGIQQFSAAEFNGSRKNMIVITDGVPNANSITYTTADGIYPYPGAPTPTCTNNCTDAKLWTMAQNQATVARNAGINVSTIYYSGGTSAALKPTYRAQLATLSGGTGISLEAPTSAAINSAFAGFCATMSSSVKAVY